jgi:hypothetical protein
MMGRPRVQGENTHSECIACIPPSYARKGCHPSQLLSRYSIESLSAGRKLTTSQRTGLSQLRRPPRGHNEKSHIAAAALRTPLPIQSMRSAPATLKTTKPPSIQAVTPPSTSARRCVSPQSKLDIHLHTRQKARMAQPRPPARATPTGTFGREPVPHPSKKNIAQTNPIAPRIKPTTHGDGAACEFPRLLRGSPDGSECAPRTSSTIAPTPISM